MRTLALALAATVALPLAAQGRTLSWPRIDVAARLDADGRLHVVERQRIRFDGAWNGGERRFAVKPTQDFAFESIVRLDPATGTRHAMRAGDIDAVDGWQRKGTTVRWRSRLATDPAFANEERTYELRFRLGDVLVTRRDRPGRYLLDHDFAFADRDGTIDTLVVTLDIDPAWRTDSVRTLRWMATGLAPGRGFGVDVPLARLSPTPPASVRLPASPATGWALVAACAAVVALALARLRAHDRASGRTGPLAGPDTVTPAFLERECFAHLPEVVGAAWDGRTGAPEVAALLARLVQERKLASRVESSRALVFRRQVLHLDLLVDRATLRAHERTLIDGLFAPGARSTSTDEVRARYAKTGFDPAGLLDTPLATMARGAITARTPVAAASAAERVTIPLVLLAAALACGAVGGVRAGSLDVAIALVGAAASIPFVIVALVVAHAHRHRATGLGVTFAWLAATLLVAVLALGLVLATDVLDLRPSPWPVAALACWLAMVAWWAALRARTVESRETIAWRRRLAAVRAFFARELRRPAPRLQDAWYPWMLAFGLGPHVDRWFRAFGGEVARTAGVVPVGTPGSAGSVGDAPSGSGTAFGGFGGGGGFSGGGGGAEFGSAMSAFAASVPSPSSGASGSSSGSSSSSSGGGGGGGW